MASNTAEIITAVGAIITPITVAYLLYLQVRAGKKQDVIHHQINGMQEKMIIAEKAASNAEGNLEGRKEQAAESKPVVDVKIVDQKEPVKVVTEKPEKK